MPLSALVLIRVYTNATLLLGWIFSHAYTCKNLPVVDIECSQKAFTLSLSVCLC